MSEDFPRVNEALATSIGGRGLTSLDRVLRSAWRTSSTRAAAQSINRSLHGVPAAQVVRGIATAVAIAAALQPVLMRVMPATVQPAMPGAVFAVTAVLSGLIAWRAEAVIQAWPNSALARLLGR